MFDMKISSDLGLSCGNISIFPRQLAAHVEGIDLVDGLLVIEGVKFFNGKSEKFIIDRNNNKHHLETLMSAA